MSTFFLLLSSFFCQKQLLLPGNINLQFPCVVEHLLDHLIATHQFCLKHSFHTGMCCLFADKTQRLQRPWLIHSLSSSFLTPQHCQAVGRVRRWEHKGMETRPQRLEVSSWVSTTWTKDFQIVVRCEFNSETILFTSFLRLSLRFVSQPCADAQVQFVKALIYFSRRRWKSCLNE